jgi:hypothetical protein
LTFPFFRGNLSSVPHESRRTHLRKLRQETGRVATFPSHEVGVDSSPVWSEGGIIFSSNCDWDGAEAHANLYLMSSEGKLQARLTTAQVFDVYGDW